MSPQNDSFSDYVEIEQWISKRNSYIASEALDSMSAAIPPFDFEEDDEDDDFDWE